MRNPSDPGRTDRIEPTGAFGKRDELIEAAMSEFAECYFDAASLNAILKAAGIGKGTFYYHFGSKENLYLAVVDQLAEKKTAFLRERAGPRTEGEDLISLLHRQGRLSAEFALLDPRIGKLSLRIPHEPNPALREAAQQRAGGRAEEFLDPLVRRAMETGELRDDLSADFVVKLLAFLFAGFASAFQSRAENRPTDDPKNQTEVLKAFDDYMDFIRHGLGGVHRNYRCDGHSAGHRGANRGRRGRLRPGTEGQQEPAP